MVITIGEIVDELIPFSSLVRSNILSGFPYVTASIRGGGNCTRLYISVMQMSEHFYAVAVTDDVFNGNRYIPTGNPDKPFIHEKTSCPALPEPVRKGGATCCIRRKKMTF